MLKGKKGSMKRKGIKRKEGRKERKKGRRWEPFSG
jgi:hypothetical protein